MARILFVEPESELNAQTADSLRNMGHVVDAYELPEKAREAAQHIRYDLLITEYKIPGSKGTAIFRDVFEFQLLPAIITTDLPEEALDETVGNLPMAPRIVKKPYTIWDLNKQIEKLLLSHNR